MLAKQEVCTHDYATLAVSPRGNSKSHYIMKMNLHIGPALVTHKNLLQQVANSCILPLTIGYCQKTLTDTAKKTVRLNSRLVTLSDPTLPTRFHVRALCLSRDPDFLNLWAHISKWVKWNLQLHCLSRITRWELNKQHRQLEVHTLPSSKLALRREGQVTVYYITYKGPLWVYFYWFSDECLTWKVHKKWIITVSVKIICYI